MMNHEELKNSTSDYISAIDVGTTKIVAVIGKKNKSGRIRIMGMGSVPTPQNSVKRGVVLNLNEASNAIRAAIDIAEEKSGLKIEKAYVGIAGQHIKSQVSSHHVFLNVEDNEITDEDVRQLRADMFNMAMEPGEETLHVIPQTYNVDNEHGVINPVGMLGRKLIGNYHVVIGDITSAQNITRCVEKLKVDVSKLILEPIASAAAVLTDDEKEAGVALVDIGGGTTDIAIFYDGVLRHTAVIPYGGNTVTQDIKQGYGILNRYAEELKTKFGYALAEFAPKDSIAVIPGVSGRDSKEIHLDILGQIIQARMEEIIGIVDFEIQKSGFRNRLGAGIALTGGGSQLTDLTHLVNFKTGLTARIANPVNYLAQDERDELKNPKFSTAVGLILQGFDYDYLNSVTQAEKDKLEQYKQEAIAREEAEILATKHEIELEEKRKQEELAEIEQEKARVAKRLNVGNWFGEKINDIFGADNKKIDDTF